uniref:Complexin-1 n=1 Tax=Poecilia latipinna TaxID=48699 RepID=A0A3B3V8H3_9TELE
MNVPTLAKTFLISSFVFKSAMILFRATKDMGKMLGGEEEKDPDAQKKEEERQEALRQQEEERKAKYARMEAERENLRQGIRDKVRKYIWTFSICLWSKCETMSLKYNSIPKNKRKK